MYKTHEISRMVGVANKSETRALRLSVEEVCSILEIFCKKQINFNRRKDIKKQNLYLTAKWNTFYTRAVWRRTCEKINRSVKDGLAERSLTYKFTCMYCGGSGERLLVNKFDYESVNFTCFKIFSKFEGNERLLTRAASFSISITWSIFPIVKSQRGDSGSILFIYVSIITNNSHSSISYKLRAGLFFPQQMRLLTSNKTKTQIYWKISIWNTFNPRWSWKYTPLPHLKIKSNWPLTEKNSSFASLSSLIAESTLTLQKFRWVGYKIREPILYVTKRGTVKQVPFGIFYLPII